MSRSRSLSVGLVLLIGACNSGPPLSLSVPEEGPPPTRPSDALLERPELQAIVDLQVLRDGEGLMGHLEDEDPTVRARAAFALASVQAPEAVPALQRLLLDDEPSVRRDAAFSLGQIAHPSNGTALLDALTAEQDAAARIRMIEALGKVGEAVIVAGLRQATLDESEQPHRALAFARFAQRDMHDADVLDWIVEGLSSGEPELRVYAAYYFARILGPEAWRSRAGHVRAALDSYEWRDPAAMYLLTAIARLGDPGDAARLAGWLSNGGDWRVRVNAASAIGGAEAIRALSTDVLVNALRDPSSHVGVASAQALAQGLDAGDAHRLVSGLGQGRPWVIDAPLLAPLAREGEGEAVLEWFHNLSAEAPARARAAGLEALALVGGEVARETLLQYARGPQHLEGAAALRALVGRWGVEQKNPELQGTYFAIFVAGVQREEANAVSSAAQGLSDTLFLDRGGRDTLEAVFRRGLSAGREGVGSILTAMAASGDPRTEALAREGLESSSARLRRSASRALAQVTGVEASDRDGQSTRDDAPAIDWPALSALGRRPHLILETERGRVVLELNSEEAPLTVQTITSFASAGQYDGVYFHRVIGNFVAQGGDFSQGDGSGGPGFSIRSEFTQTPYLRSVLGMASAGKDTEGSQFFLTHSMQPHLDGGYTAFGWVVEGMDVVDQLSLGDRVLRATVEPDHP